MVEMSASLCVRGEKFSTSTFLILSVLRVSPLPELARQRLLH